MKWNFDKIFFFARSLSQMHSRFLIFIWRKKLLLLATSLAFLVAIVWGFFYSTHSLHDADSSKGLSIKVKME
jgi:hypothetical protein